jgi:hypothetical protein
MLIERIEPRRVWTEHVIVRLLRRWTAAREAGRNSTASLVELAAELAEPAMVAVALDSLFQLTESCLGRPLRAESCCSRTLGADERAVLLMITTADAPGAPYAAPEIPHGLPGALSWAVTSLRCLLADRLGALAPDGGGRCPFERVEPAPPLRALRRS